MKKWEAGETQSGRPAVFRGTQQIALIGDGMGRKAAERIAHLIAATPDLLAAPVQCEDLLAELQSGGAENPELEVARAAIAKARVAP